MSAAREFRRPVADINDDGHLDRLFVQRYTAISALAIGAALFDMPLAIPILIVVVGFGATALAHLQARHRGQAPVWMHLVDMLGVLIFPAVSDRTTVPAMFIMLAVVSLAASMSGLGPAVASAVVGVVGLVLIEAADPFERGPVYIASFAIAA
ncbi:MAG: hypothetical protein U0P45_05825, partial [Acidimicrobiales bacterium]